jgi:hypothetical protein
MQSLRWRKRVDHEAANPASADSVYQHEQRKKVGFP